MTPYLIGSTWIDLEHVQTISEGLHYNTALNPAIKGVVTLAFRSEPLEIVVGYIRRVSNTEFSGIEGAMASWDSFIAAWKDSTHRSALAEMITQKTRELVNRETARFLNDA